jgi:hypothetical protein
MEGFLIFIGASFAFFFALIMMSPYSTIPSPSQKEAALVRCNQLHGQLELQNDYYNAEDIRNINCITPSGYYSLYKSEYVYIWEYRFRHPQNGETFH